MTEGMNTCVQRAKKLYSLIDGNPDFEGIEEKKIIPITNLIIACEIDRLCNSLDTFNQTMKNLKKRLDAKGGAYFQTDGDKANKRNAKKKQDK